MAFNMIFNELINSSNIATVIICGIILYLTLRTLIKIYSSKKHAKALVKTFSTIFQDKEYINREILNHVDNEISSPDTLVIWQKFRDNLVTTETKSGHEVFYTIYPIKDFFDLNLVGGELIKNKLITAMPAILTGLGLFGTFLGLTIGLNGLDLNSPEELQDGISKVVTGASTAFITSLAGIGASLLINYIEKRTINSIKNKLKKLREKLYHLFPQIKIEETFIKMENNSFNIREAMQGMAEQIGNKMQEGMQEATAKMNEEITRSLSLLVDSTKSWGERVTSGSETALNSIIEQFIDKIGTSANSQKEMLEKSSEKMSSVVDNLDKIISGYSQITNDSFANMQRQQEISSEFHQKAIEEFVAKQKEGLNEYNSKLSEISDSVIEQQKSQTKILNNLLDKTESVSSHLADELKDLEQNLNNVNNKVKNIIASFEKTVIKFSDATEHLQKTGDIFHEAGEKIVEPINESINEFQNLTAKNLEAQEKVKQLTDNLSNIVEESDEILSSVNSLLENSNNSFNRLSREQQDFLVNLKNTFTDLSENTKNRFEQYSESLQKQTSDRLNQWNEKTQEFSHSMLNTVRSIQTIVDGLEQKSS